MDGLNYSGYLFWCLGDTGKQISFGVRIFGSCSPIELVPGETLRIKSFGAGTEQGLRPGMQRNGHLPSDQGTTFLQWASIQMMILLDYG